MREEGEGEVQGRERNEEGRGGKGGKEAVGAGDRSMCMAVLVYSSNTAFFECFF